MSVPAIPQRGLEAALRAWTGRGTLIDAIAAPVDPDPQRAWAHSDVLRRARRVLWEELVDELLRWPQRPNTWLDALPVQRERSDLSSPSPSSGTRWARARLGGWPPRHFPVIQRTRTSQQLTMHVLAWTLGELAPIRAQAPDPVDDRAREAQRRADAGLAILNDLLARIGPPPPGMPLPADVRAVRSQGRPWRALADVAARLRALHDPAETARLALELLAPDPAYAWRLFHLAVLGELLLALRAAGADVISLRPLGVSASGPAFEVRDADGGRWDLWFEAAGAWSAYGVREPYLQVAEAVPGASQPLGADLMLIQAPRRALVLECKFSDRPEYVARDGYHQLVTYVVEADLLASGTSGWVIGPSDVVRSYRNVDLGGSLVGIARPEDLQAIIEHALVSLDEPADQ